MKSAVRKADFCVRQRAFQPESRPTANGQAAFTGRLGFCEFAESAGKVRGAVVAEKEDCERWAKTSLL